MRTLYLVAATTMLVGLIPARLPAEDIKTPAATLGPACAPNAVVASNAVAAPDAVVASDAVAVPVAEEAPAACEAKSGCPRLARLWDWLTYQPLHRPCQACRHQPMPCCPPPLYTYFPCVDCHGQCPMGGYGCKTCGQ